LVLERVDEDMVSFHTLLQPADRPPLQPSRVTFRVDKLLAPSVPGVQNKVKTRERVRAIAAGSRCLRSSVRLT
jgi:hypothetical protein